jgi:hypothetical protein
MCIRSLPDALLINEPVVASLNTTIVAEIAFYSLSQEVSASDALLSDCGVNLFEQIHGDIQQNWFVVSFGVKQSSLLRGEYIYWFEQHSGRRIELASGVWD